MIKICREYWYIIVIYVLSFLFLAKMFSSATEYKEMTAEFKIKCEVAGGVMFVQTGVKGWAIPECRNPDAFIDIQ